MEWILVPEYVAVVFIAVYIVNSLLDSRISTPQNILYRISLYVSLASTIANIISIYAVTDVISVSHAFNVFINSMYFLLAYLMITVIVLALLAMLYEDNLTAKSRRTADVGCVCLLLVSLGILAANVKTGWIFGITPEGGYVRGPINGLTYYLLLADIVMGAIVMRAGRARVKRSFLRIVISLAVITPVMAGVQLLFPNTLLTGSIAALVLTVMLIYGQQQRIHIDHLTQLAGREMFYQTLNSFVLRNKRFHVIFVSLRDFKTVNNRFGQLAGDELLRGVSAYLGHIDAHAVACRFSGVEFSLVLPYRTGDNFERVFETLCARFHEPWPIGAESVLLAASIVEIGYPEHAKDVNELISALEYAVRQARSQKTGCVIRFNKQLRNASGRFYYALSQLAIARPENYKIWLQPVHDCRTGLPVGAEVLLRLLDENGRIIMHGEFIPIAEDTGRIAAIDWMVIEKTCALLSAHPDLGVDWLSVNLTPVHSGEEIVSRVGALLTQYGVSRGRLKLEVTERVFTSDLPAIDSAVQQLSDMGVGVFLDDFGTGYSNFYKTCRLPFECIKIDRSFVTDIETDAHACDILNMLIASFSSLKADITVEGVETKAQRDIVKSFGADHIQGFYYARPMEAEDFFAYVKACIS